MSTPKSCGFFPVVSSIVFFQTCDRILIAVPLTAHTACIVYERYLPMACDTNLIWYKIRDILCSRRTRYSLFLSFTPSHNIPIL